MYISIVLVTLQDNITIYSTLKHGKRGPHKQIFTNLSKSFLSISFGESSLIIQGDQKVSVHLMITVQEVKSNVQSVPRQSADTY
jgi:hypothetical protein